MLEVNIDPSWKEHLADEFNKPYFDTLVTTLHQKKLAWETIYPAWNSIFRAFSLTPWDDVRVVILGQDPYHGPWQAHGLSFSVPAGVRIPPSLSNIFKECKADVWGEIPPHGDLTCRAEQWVLLLNAILTVNAGQPASHHALWWQHFTDAVLRVLSEKKQWCVFVLWGNFAKQKECLIDQSRHLVLTAAHPSPYAAHQGFFGCGHFGRINAWLVDHGQQPITWLQSTSSSMNEE
jgi:uracil-DNA glycosylase